MSIDKDSEDRSKGGLRISFGTFLVSILRYAVLITPGVLVFTSIFAIELGLGVRVFKEAYEWGYNFLFFG